MRETREARDRGYADAEDGTERPYPDDRVHEEGKQQAREGDSGGNDCREDPAQPAAEDGLHDPERNADGHTDQRREHGELEGQAGRGHRPGEDVAAELVRPEEMRG